MPSGLRPGRSTPSRESRPSAAGSTASPPTRPIRSCGAARASGTRSPGTRCRPEFDELGQHAEPLRDWSARTEEPALQTELRSLLTTAIDDLPGDYKTAFLLHDVEGLSNPEIAETLHISLPAVKSRVHRSRLFLRQRLADYMRAA